MEEKYNGWTNYETWLLKAWINNDETDYNYFQNVARQTLENVADKDKQQADFADHIKNYFADKKPRIKPIFFQMLLETAFGRIDFKDISISILEDMEK